MSTIETHGLTAHYGDFQALLLALEEDVDGGS